MKRYKKPLCLITGVLIGIAIMSFVVFCFKQINLTTIDYNATIVSVRAIDHYGIFGIHRTDYFVNLYDAETDTMFLANSNLLYGECYGHEGESIRVKHVAWYWLTLYLNHQYTVIKLGWCDDPITINGSWLKMEE